jgi:7-cyano-7-deazaguanine synthase in queuosine biosynthesis
MGDAPPMQQTRKALIRKYEMISLCLEPETAGCYYGLIESRGTCKECVNCTELATRDSSAP